MKVSGKGSSLAAQIFAAVWIAIGTICKALKLIEIEMLDIILSGVVIAGCFLPVYFSIILDKIKDIKIGKVD